MKFPAATTVRNVRASSVSKAHLRAAGSFQFYIETTDMIDKNLSLVKFILHTQVKPCAGAKQRRF